jgi:hypothetical protein
LNEPSPPLWPRFPELYQDTFEAFYYNLAWGAGVKPAGDAAPEMRRNSWATTALCIDPVGERENPT